MNKSPHYVVRATFITRFSPKNPRFSGYCEEQEMIQKLIKRTLRRFLFWNYWQEDIIDSEIVPSYVWISKGALGYDTSGWLSKFAEYIKS